MFALCRTLWFEACKPRGRLLFVLRILLAVSETIISSVVGRPVVGLRDAPPRHRAPRGRRVAGTAQHVGGPRALRGRAHRPDHLLVAALDGGDGLGGLVPNRETVLGAGGVPVPRRPAGIPEAALQPLVPHHPTRDPRGEHRRGRGARLPVLRDSRGGSLTGDGHVGRAVEHYERHCGHLEPARDLRVGRDLRVQGQGTRPHLGRSDDRVDHRLRPVEPRLRVQLPGGPSVVLGRGAAGLVHDPGAHEVRARRVDPVPRVHAHAMVGRGAHVPALHAGFDVRPPQRPQPLGDAHPLGGRPGSQRVGVRRARAHDYLQAAQPAHAGSPRRRGHLRLVGP